MKCDQYFLACFFVLVTFVNGFPSQCKEDKYFDHTKQIYLPCSKCENKDIGCHICCSDSKAGLIDASMSSKTVSMSSLEEKSDKSRYHILNIFLQSFIITMVICTLLVLVCVAYKVNRERQSAECPQESHFNNAGVNVVQEVHM